MIELYIENQRVDVNETFSTILTFAIDDIKNFGSKETAFSKAIVLPGTNRNNNLFGNIFNIQSANGYNPTLSNYGINFNSAVSARALIMNGNIQCFKGIVRLLEIVVDNGLIEYEVSVFGEMGGFISNRGNQKLENLDFSAYDHTYSITNIATSWDTASAGSGYYYPLIDYGNYSALKHNWKYRALRPALYAKEYIDKIFTASGYTYDCDLFNTTRFKSLVVPHNQKALIKKGSELVRSSLATPYTTGLLAGNLNFDTNSLTNFSYASGVFTFLPSLSESLNLKFELTGIYKLTGGSDTLNISIQKNGVDLLVNTLETTLGDVVDYSVYFELTSIVFNQNDTLRIRVLLFPEDRDGDYSITFNNTLLTALGSATTLVNVNINDALLVNDTLPKNILQLDFFSSILKLFNLYVFESATDDKLLLIKPFVDFYADAEIVDWSLKLDRSQPIRIKPMSELNARYYQFSFKDDADYHNDTYKKRYNLSYGSFLYDSEFEFAKETDKVDLVFSPTVLVGYTGEDKVFSTIFKRTGTEDSPIEENIDSNIRLLLAKKITGVTSWDILADDGATVLSSKTVYPYAGHFDDPDAPANDIQFGVPQELFFQVSTGALNVNQFNVYWSSYMAEITDKDSKLLKAKFKLSYKDIYNLDFSKLIYIDGSLFRINRIENFNATREDLCDVELLKIINKIY